MAKTPAQEPINEIPLIAGEQTYGSITDHILDVPLKQKVPKIWYLFVGIGFLLIMVFLFAVTKLVLTGIGIWGVNVPVGWGFAIINFVWWIGIGHAGTLISAILLLLKQPWRMSINRFAEAMTLFAVACAGVFPLLHTGRPWLAYWMMPYPNVLGVWPQFRSPLIWDVFAVTTYMTVSALFWYTGLIPDLGTMRDRLNNKWLKLLVGFFALGWRNSAKHWARYELAYLLLAGLSTPLVLSVHTVVSFDFAVSLVPGWHATVFPPYFVAGAIYAGFAMVLTLLIPLRVMFKMQNFITMKHIDMCAKVMLGTGLIVVYGYCMEAFFGWYSANPYESFMITNRMTGPYMWFYWALILCNGVIPQLLWVPKFRNNIVLLFIIAMSVNVGMWLERFIIVVTSLHRDFLPSSWDMYWPTVWDWSLYLGTIGLFIALIFLFVRFLPMISAFEVRELLSRTKEKHK